MTPQPRLLATSSPKAPEAAVLVLHGGASRRGSPMVSPTQLSVLRMVPIARRMARVGGRRLAVFRLLNSTRGWDSRHTPVDDVQWALGQVEKRWGSGVPIGLIGHSLGGRAALLAGESAGIQSVVALNPWLYATEDPNLADRQTLIVHGDEDRIADPTRSATVARRIGRRADVAYVRVEGGKHAMLRRHRTFDALAVDFTAAVLLDRTTSGVAAAAVAGEKWQTA